MHRIKLFPNFAIRGAPPPRRKSRFVLHASWRRPETSNIDFSSLDLQYPLVVEPNIQIKRIGWSPPPETKPDLPFRVSNSVSTKRTHENSQTLLPAGVSRGPYRKHSCIHRTSRGENESDYNAQKV